MRTTGWVVFDKTDLTYFVEDPIAGRDYTHCWTDNPRRARVFLTKEAARDVSNLTILRRTRRKTGGKPRTGKVRTVGWKIQYRDPMDDAYKSYLTYKSYLSGNFWTEKTGAATLYKTRFEVFAEKNRACWFGDSDITVVRITRRRKTCAQ